MTTQSTTEPCSRWRYRRTPSGCLITANGPDSMYGYAIERVTEPAVTPVYRSTIDWD